jgi:ATP-dependent RNA helicase DeaD
MVHYRIEVGRNDGVSPREIVGAIANEAGLEGRHIGRIDIRDDHCVVDLPDGMPKEIYRHLQGVFVCGKALRLHLLGEEAPEARPQGRREGRPQGRSEGRPERPRREHTGPRSNRPGGDRAPRNARPRPPKRKD